MSNLSVSLAEPAEKDPEDNMDMRHKMQNSTGMQKN